MHEISPVLKTSRSLKFNRRKLARLIKQYRDIFSNISEGTAFLLHPEEGMPRLRNIGNYIPILFNQPC